MSACGILCSAAPAWQARCELPASRGNPLDALYAAEQAPRALLSHDFPPVDILRRRGAVANTQHLQRRSAAGRGAVWGPGSSVSLGWSRPAVQLPRAHPEPQDPLCQGEARSHVPGGLLSTAGGQDRAVPWAGFKQALPGCPPLPGCTRPRPLRPPWPGLPALQRVTALRRRTVA